MEKPRVAALRDLADLAAEGAITPQAVYQAARKGYVPFIPFGRRLKMTEAAFQYHARFGYGPTVPRHGTAEAAEYERRQTAEDATAVEAAA